MFIFLSVVAILSDLFITIYMFLGLCASIFATFLPLIYLIYLQHLLPLIFQNEPLYPVCQEYRALNANIGCDKKGKYQEQHHYKNRSHARIKRKQILTVSGSELWNSLRRKTAYDNVNYVIFHYAGKLRENRSRSNIINIII